MSDDTQWPGPWHFHASLWGLSNVIADRDGRFIVANVPADTRTHNPMYDE